MNPPTNISIPLFPIALILALASFFVVSLISLAVSPPPDGGYPGDNTAEGQNALLSLTSGLYNTAVGFSSLKSNTMGSLNTAMGVNALSFNTTGVNNTANGVNALYGNTTGSRNTANGVYALFRNTGDENTANGAFALVANTAGALNTGTGVYALFNNTTGNYNTAIGHNALVGNIYGNQNTGIGTGTLFLNESGSYNTAVGGGAGFNVRTASNVTCIGSRVPGADVSNTTWIGNVYGVTTQNGATAPVIVSADGQLGTVVSSERFKKDIATMDKASEGIISLRPVTFHYKADSKGTPQFGLIAEEVAKVNPDLVVRDKEGKPYTVRYEAVNAMLLNEFLKEHLKNEAQQATIAQLKSGMEALTATVKEQAAQIQKVSAQLEASKTAPQVADSN